MPSGDNGDFGMMHTGIGQQAADPMDNPSFSFAPTLNDTAESPSLPLTNDNNIFANGLLGLLGLPSKESLEALSAKMEELRRAPPRQSLDAFGTPVGYNFHMNNPLTGGHEGYQNWYDANVASMDHPFFAGGGGGGGTGVGSRQNRVFYKAGSPFIGGLGF